MTEPVSWQPEVYVNPDGWVTNSLRFATEQEAKENAEDLLNRWFVPVDSRAMPSDDVPNAVYHNHQLTFLENKNG